MSELLVDHVSHSQLTEIQSCPYEWFLLKVIGVQQYENGFAQSGSLAHEILAMWAKGEIKAAEMQIQWIERFPKEVTAEFPHYLAAKGYVNRIFESVLRYFERFDGFPGYEVVAAEKEFESTIDGVRFVGIIDLILREKRTGDLMLVDHKSASHSTYGKTCDEMYRQLLLYSKHCEDAFGTFPKKLAINLYREGILDMRPFSIEEYKAAYQWAESMIEEMKRKDLTDWFETRPEFFRCTNLCACRNECAYGRAENHKRKVNTHVA